MYKIVWENSAIQEQVEIFEFWNKHNHSNSYSIKIFEEIERVQKLLKENPFIGRDTNFKRIKRILILERFSLFYKISDKTIIILSVWDNYRNPDDLILR